MDSGGAWWTDSELNNYLDAWQDKVNDELEFVWGTATYATSSSTCTLTDIATDILRPSLVYWEATLLSPLTTEELSIIKRDWRNVTTGGVPAVVYQETEGEFGLWPPPDSTGTLTLEYPVKLSFSTDTDTCNLPPWTRYSCVDYCAYRAYARNGPTADMNRALAYKAAFKERLLKYKKVKRKFFPRLYTGFVEAEDFEKRLVSPSFGGLDVIVTGVSGLAFYDEVPSGTINGSNDTFTLTHSPSPTDSLKLFLDGVLLKQGTHYTLSGSTITFVAAYIPQTGQTLFASYRYAT